MYFNCRTTEILIARGEADSALHYVNALKERKEVKIRKHLQVQVIEPTTSNFNVAISTEGWRIFFYCNGCINEIFSHFHLLSNLRRIFPCNIDGISVSFSFLFWGLYFS